MAHLGLEAVQDRIANACDRAGRTTDDVSLVVVSKNRSDAEVQSVYDAGHRVFAENREQGLRARITSDLPQDIEWHFVGPLQSRKAAFVGQHVELLHSMDRDRLARVWVERSSAPVLIQFNMADEPQKSGFLPDAAEKTLESLLEIGVSVAGVMAIPPFAEDPEATRQYFIQLRRIADSYAAVDTGITTCSMGMTNDLEVAIEEGATMVRVGRAIFA